ncbi:hydrolase [Mycobacterium sp. E136]|uniref:alpha/beta fold hydrolase n=1 Tax=Mycobacterium sp. E136 TaxID=1834125 RepID=UPI0007FE4CD8|nr:alpha/beta hydrolase [Mycobacterium sp. E136]OBG94847.1 hydrolase [Mycobacterium sp. E136]
MTAEVTTRDGRRLAYEEVGDPNGPLVIHNHGGPSSRLEVRLLADSATSNGIRLVGVDRPGIGRSSVQKARSYGGWAEDLTAVADALGHREFGVTGWSEGGPWALAAAAYIDPQRLRHVSSIAPGSYGAFGDNSAAPYLSKVDAMGGRLALRFPAGFKLMYAALGLSAKHMRNGFLKTLRGSVNEYDQEILSRSEVADDFMNAVAECFAPGSVGLVRDAELLYRRWDFDVSRIDRPVHLWQGLDDRLVPDPINKAVSDAMPGAVWHPVEGAGHFVAIGSGDEIFAVAAAELQTPRRLTP